MNERRELLRWIDGRQVSLLAFAALALGALSAGCSQSTGADSGVRVFNESERGAPAAQFSSLAAATADASAKAAFPIVAPTRLPSGWSVVEIDIHPLPPVSTGSSLRRATVKVRSGDRQFNIMQVNSPFDFEGKDDAHRLASPAPGAELFKVEGDLGVDYTLLTPTRGYVLTMLKPFPISQDEAVKILGSLPSR